MSISIQGQPIKIALRDGRGESFGTTGVSRMTLSQIESKVNQFAGKLLQNYLEIERISKDNVTITPFKVKERQQKGKGRISHGINQSQQLSDFESWVSPGAQVINYI